MKKFQGTRMMSDLIDQFESHAFATDRREYDNQGSDFIAFRNGWIGTKFIVLCLVYPWNGRFICNPTGRIGEHVTERSEEMEGTSWYDELLSMIYIPEGGTE